MKCPVCHINLNNYQVPEIDLDICPKCEGVWFDKGEFQHILNRLLSADAIQEQPIKKALRKNVLPINDSQLRSLICPLCNNQLDLRNFSFDSNVFVDKCSSCHGLWTDRGELLEIAEYMRSNDELDKYANSVAILYKNNENQFIKFIETWQNYISGLIGAIYILLFFWMEGPKSAWAITLKFLPVPLGLIWFGDTLGNYTGFFWRPPFGITKTTPGYIVKLVGWIFLLSPVLLFPFILIYKLLEQS